MKLRLFILFIFGSTMLSCSSDEQSPSAEEFFNLNVGNEWVYKRYKYDYFLQNEGVQIGTDSVKVVGVEILNGLEFAKVEHRFFTFDPEPWEASPQSSYQYLRVNNLGHLRGYNVNHQIPEDLSLVTETSGSFYHPGNNIDYVASNTSAIGTMDWNTLSTNSIIVDGIEYSVISYVTNYTPADSDVITRTVQQDYQSQVGLVRAQKVFASGNPGDYVEVIEDRLASYVIIP